MVLSYSFVTSGQPHTSGPSRTCSQRQATVKKIIESHRESVLKRYTVIHVQMIGSPIEM